MSVTTPSKLSFFNLNYCILEFQIIFFQFECQIFFQFGYSFFAMINLYRNIIYDMDIFVDLSRKSHHPEVENNMEVLPPYGLFGLVF